MKSGDREVERSRFSDSFPQSEAPLIFKYMFSNSVTSISPNESAYLTR